uniref:Alpha-MPP n=1 Tax=Aplanochytrium stocchinoi TaxID=215587 RepID=A0A7S3UY37_9STRA|mmetsp:Transcript_22355/g.27340  ORF Transcript_22355/g.27340 Transcript_22355/m.27340 type:complete len:487 (+) Transcript_22355:200-1660(+)
MKVATTAARALGKKLPKHAQISVRSFSAAQAQPSLDMELPGIPPLSPASAQPKPETKITTLANGLRVASEETYGQVSTIGMFIDAGSRYENDSNSGVSHLLEHMAFKSTENRSHLRLVRDIEDVGGTVGAASSRECIMYTGECLRDNVETIVDVMADSILRPALKPWDIEDQREVIGYELQAMEQNAQALLTELLHSAAYGESTPLGQPLWCPERNLGKLNADTIRSFMSKTFLAKRMVLSGAGVDHDELVSLAEKYFADLATAPPAGETEPAMLPSPYKGGDRRVSGDSPFTHVALCFDAGSWMSDDLLELCTLHLLLGGGGSFSAGGPGKGMYSRLYTNVLNQHHWVDSATAFNSMYADAGLIGIYGTCLPQDAGRLVDVMSAELISIAGSAPGEEETNRAKNQLKSSMLMKLESRQVLFEDIGRQILTYGKRESPAELCARVDKVTPEGIQKIAKKALSSPVTVASFGNNSEIPAYEEIAKKF